MVAHDDSRRAGVHRGWWIGAGLVLITAGALSLRGGGTVPGTADPTLAREAAAEVDSTPGVPAKLVEPLIQEAGSPAQEPVEAVQQPERPLDAELGEARTAVRSTMAPWTVRARVLELDTGAPVEGHPVELMWSGERVASAVSNEDGRVEITAPPAELERLGIELPARGFRLAHSSVHPAIEGEEFLTWTDAPSEPGVHSVELLVRLWPPEPAGPITGRLLPESGVFGGDVEALLRGLTLDLVSLESPRISARASLTPVLNGDGALVAIGFTTEELPAITFELTLSSLDHRRWSPTSQRVLAPTDGVEFFCHDGDESAPLAFKVTDAASGEPIPEARWSALEVRMTVSEENGVLLHAGPLELDAFPLDAALQWTVEARGYASAFGTERDFVPDPESGVRTAHVALERGFSGRLLVLGRDPDRRPAVGATVRLDGSLFGRTDGRGQLLLGGKEPPGEIEVEWRGELVEGTFDEVTLPRRGSLYVVLVGG